MLKKPLINHKAHLIAAILLFVTFQLIVTYLMYNVAFSLFSYVCIIFSCIFCAFLSDGSRSALFTQIGLLGTVGADLFLVFLPVQRRVPGMICFCVTQIAYFLRIYHEDDHPLRRKLHLILRAVASVSLVAATFIVLGSRVDAVSVLSLFYYANLACNVIFAFLHFKKSGVLALALLAFLLSDTLLGFSSLSDYFLIPRGSFIYSVLYFGRGLFYPLYIISQIAIPLSLASRKWKSIEKR